MLTSPSWCILKWRRFSQWVRRVLLDTWGAGECSCLVHFCYVEPPFWIDAHIAHAAPFEAGLMITSPCSFSPTTMWIFGIDAHIAPLALFLILPCLFQIFVYNHDEARTGFLASRVGPYWTIHQ